jgi:hypothetical protein
MQRSFQVNKIGLTFAKDPIIFFISHRISTYLYFTSYLLNTWVAFNFKDTTFVLILNHSLDIKYYCWEYLISLKLIFNWHQNDLFYSVWYVLQLYCVFVKYKNNLKAYENNFK